MSRMHEPRRAHTSGTGTARRPSNRARGRVVAATLGTLVLSGCYLLDPDLLPAGTTEVSIGSGESAQVDLGE